MYYYTIRPNGIMVFSKKLTAFNFLIKKVYLGSIKPCYLSREGLSRKFG